MMVQCQNETARWVRDGNIEASCLGDEPLPFGCNPTHSTGVLVWSSFFHSWAANDGLGMHRGGYRCLVLFNYCGS